MSTEPRDIAIFTSQGNWKEIKKFETEHPGVGKQSKHKTQQHSKFVFWKLNKMFYGYSNRFCKMLVRVQIR